MAIAADIAEALVAVLKTNGFPEAELRGSPYLQLDQSASRKCVVTFGDASYEGGSREDMDAEFELYVVLQKGCLPASLTALKALLDDVQTLVGLWAEDGALRHTELAGASYNSGPAHANGSMYDHGDLNEKNLFTSMLTVRYGT